MSKTFSGVWATFEYLDDMCDAIKDLRGNGHKELTTHSPCPRHEIDHALHSKESRVPFFTLVAALLGFSIAILFLTWATLDWVLPVSSKDIVSAPPFIVIGFELTVLFGAYGTMFGTVLLIVMDTLKSPTPKSNKYKNYNRFTNDRFGIVVPCNSGDQNNVEEIMKKYQAEEVNSET